MALPAALRVAVAVLVVAVVAGCGAEADSDGVPDGAVAVVGGTEIAQDELDREVAALARARRDPASSAALDEQGEDLTPRQRRALLEEQALAILLQRQAIEQEAARRNVRVDRAEVRRRWERLSGEQFETQEQLETFLGGLTVAEVVEQLRLQQLAESIHAQVRERAGGGAAGERAVREFEEGFAARWAARSTCADPYEVPGC